MNCKSIGACLRQSAPDFIFDLDSLCCSVNSVVIDPSLTFTVMPVWRFAATFVVSSPVILAALSSNVTPFKITLPLVMDPIDTADADAGAPLLSPPLLLQPVKARATAITITGMNI
jgi:hypothetical protein